MIPPDSIYKKYIETFSVNGKQRRADLNYALHSNLGIFPYTICRNLSVKVTPT
jgi:hypothetical protein